MKYFFSLAVIFSILLTPAFSISAAPFGGSDELAGIGGDDGRTGLGGGDGRTGTGGESGRGIALENPLAAKDLMQLFESLIDIVLVFAVPIIVFFIIYAGFLYVTARGNEGTIEKAHKALLFALVGGLLILGAKVLIEVITGTVDVFRE